MLDHHSDHFPAGYERLSSDPVFNRRMALLGAMCVKGVCTLLSRLAASKRVGIATQARIVLTFIEKVL